MHELNPSLSFDCVMFGLDTKEQALKILVYERDIFPGENSGNKNLKLFQAFDDPGRIKYDEEREWSERHYGIKINRVVTIAYYALIRIDKRSCA